MAAKEAIIPAEQVERSIRLVRGQKVMLDYDLAALYDVETGQLVRAVKRNADRFPADFAYQLTQKEFTDLKCQIGISSYWGGRRSLPYAFTEQGVAMLSSVLRSKRAAKVNIEIMRAFVRLRDILAAHKELAKKLEDLESKCDAQFRVVFDTIRQYIAPPPNIQRKPIGFQQTASESK